MLTDFNILCDPKTKENLDIGKGFLFSSKGKYPIVEGIPILLHSQEEIEKAEEKIKLKNSKIGYSWAASHWSDLHIGELLGHSSIQNNMLLNYGSGSPIEKEMMQRLGHNVVSLDINADYKGVDLIGDGHQLPFKDEIFFTVTAFEVLEHLHAPWIAIKEINRVLSDNGRFVGSVAFLKEFHSSYFHMTHWGVIQLLKYGGFEIEKIYGGQNIFSRLVHNVFPLGPEKFSKWVYDKISTSIMSSRLKYWSLKKKKSPKEISNKFDKYNFSFEEFEKIKFAPTILFSAKKVRNF